MKRNPPKRACLRACFSPPSAITEGADPPACPVPGRSGFPGRAQGPASTVCDIRACRRLLGRHGLQEYVVPPDNVPNYAKGNCANAYPDAECYIMATRETRNCLLCGLSDFAPLRDIFSALP